MRILVMTVGSAGDVHPFVGLCVKLKERGHHPTLAVTAYYAPVARAAGVDVIELGSREEFEGLIRNRDLWHPRKGFYAVADATLRALPTLYETVVQYVERYPDAVLVGSSLALATRIAQEKLGVPAATVHLSPSILRTRHEMPRLPAVPIGSGSPMWVKNLFYAFADWAVIDRVMGRGLNEFRATLGLKPVKHILEDWWNSPDRVIGMWPEWFGRVQPDWPEQTRLAHFPLWDERGLASMDPELERFLDEGPPPVAFTPGSAMVFGERFFEESARACEIAGVRGVLLSRHPGHIPKRLSAGVRHFAYAPFSELLPRCAASVHHGGIGSMAQALRAGCPQVVMPMSHDQFDNADRAERLGVARAVVMKKYVGKNVAEAIRSVTTEDVRRKAREVAARFAGADGLALACEQIEGLATTRIAPKTLQTV